MKEVVVLIHGFSAHAITLYFIKRELEKEGYEVLPLSYVTAFSNKKINDIGKDFSRLLNQKYDANTTVHFVGHSLGGIVIRSIISFSKYYQVGNVVTIGSPHKGAGAANWILKYTPFVKHILGNIIEELVIDSETISKLPYPVHHGVVVGTLNRKPWNPFAYVIDDFSDGLVELESSCQDLKASLYISNTDHVTQMWNKHVREQIVHFIKYSEFKKTD